MEREVYRLAEVPTAEAYAFAIAQASVGGDIRLALLLHSQALRAEMECSSLSKMSGLAVATLNSGYGRLGRAIKEILSLRVPIYSETDTRPLVVAALVEVSRRSPRSRWIWRLYPEVCFAIDRLGWAAP